MFQASSPLILHSLYNHTSPEIESHVFTRLFTLNTPWYFVDFASHSGNTSNYNVYIFLLIETEKGKPTGLVIDIQYTNIPVECYTDYNNVKYKRTDALSLWHQQ